MSAEKEDIKKQLKRYGFLYADTRLSDEELIDFAELAWQEIYDLEYDQAFGGWRGIHLSEETNLVNVTFDNAYGGPPLMVSISRETREKKLTYPSEEHILLENANLFKIMTAMGLPEEEAEKYRHLYIME